MLPMNFEHLGNFLKFPSNCSRRARFRLTLPLQWKSIPLTLPLHRKSILLRVPTIQHIDKKFQNLFSAVAPRRMAFWLHLPPFQRSFPLALSTVQHLEEFYGILQSFKFWSLLGRMQFCFCHCTFLAHRGPLLQPWALIPLWSRPWPSDQRRGCNQHQTNGQTAQEYEQTTMLKINS